MVENDLCKDPCYVSFYDLPMEDFHRRLLLEALRILTEEVGFSEKCSILNSIAWQLN